MYVCRLLGYHLQETDLHLSATNESSYIDVIDFNVYIGDEWNFTAWADLEPDNDDNSLYEVCLLASADIEYQWADKQCWLKARYICSFGKYYPSSGCPSDFIKGHANEYPTMHYFGNPRHILSMIA